MCSVPHKKLITNPQISLKSCCQFYLNLSKNVIFATRARYFTIQKLCLDWFFLKICKIHYNMNGEKNKILNIILFPQVVVKISLRDFNNLILYCLKTSFQPKVIFYFLLVIVFCIMSISPSSEQLEFKILLNKA